MRGQTLPPNSAVFDSIKNMMMSSPPSDRKLVYVRGYHSAVAPGGGFFLWEPTLSVPPDGGVTFPSLLQAEGRWVRQFQGTLLPQWFGALGDGSGRTLSEMQLEVGLSPWLSSISRREMLRSTATCDSLGIQLCLDRVASGVRGGHIRIPKGTYIINSSLNWSSKFPLTVMGDGSDETELLARGGRPIFEIFGARGYSTTIRGLTFRGAPREGALLRLANSKSILIEQCRFRDAQVALEVGEKCDHWILRSSTLESCTTMVSQAASSRGAIDGNDFWRHENEGESTAVLNRGKVICSHNQFMGFTNAIIDSPGAAYIRGNYFESEAGRLSVSEIGGGQTVMIENAFYAPKIFGQSIVRERWGVRLRGPA